jgi:Glutamate-cysteine ligase
MVPHLTTALTGPLQELERKFLAAIPDIERWQRTQWLEHAAPFYSSVDLRNSGFKLAPVDTNLFPGGFNNLSRDFLPLCVQAVMGAIEKICPDARGVLLIPENHTRNVHYLQNVAMLQRQQRSVGGRTRNPAQYRSADRPADRSRVVTSAQVATLRGVRSGRRRVRATRGDRSVAHQSLLRRVRGDRKACTPSRRSTMRLPSPSST